MQKSLVDLVKMKVVPAEGMNWCMNCGIGNMISAAALPKYRRKYFCVNPRYSKCFRSGGVEGNTAGRCVDGIFW